MRSKLCGAVVVALLAGGVPAEPALARTDVLLSWPESRKPVGDREHVTIFAEYFREGAPLIPPCQSIVSATLLVNDAITDTVSETTQGPWEECAATHVTGEFSRIALSGDGLAAVAQPSITITEPGPCEYSLGSVTGVGALAGDRASFSVAGTAILTRVGAGVPCKPKLPFHGAIGLFGPQSGGIGLLLWQLERTSPSGALEALNRYWGDIRTHSFGDAYALLAPRTIDLTRSQFVASERRAHIRHVEFRGRLIGHGLTRRGPRREVATVQAVSLVTSDEEFGCLNWSGDYEMINEYGAWHIKRASLNPKRCD